MVGADDGQAGKPRWCDVFHRLPSLHDEPLRFLSALEAICAGDRADVVLPNDHEGATQLLAPMRQLGGALVVAPSADQYGALCDKLGLNKARTKLTTEHFSPPPQESPQLSLF